MGSWNVPIEKPGKGGDVFIQDADDADEALRIAKLTHPESAGWTHGTPVQFG